MPYYSLIIHCKSFILMPASSVPCVSLISSLSPSIRLLSLFFDSLLLSIIDKQCKKQCPTPLFSATMILITIKPYSKISFGISIELLTYHNISIILPYRPALCNKNNWSVLLKTSNHLREDFLATGLSLSNSLFLNSF